LYDEGVRPGHGVVDCPVADGRPRRAALGGEHPVEWGDLHVQSAHHGRARRMSVPAATVYVVDDDPPLPKSFRRLLRAPGYGVVTFASSNEFLDHPERESPACLVLDVKMPGLTGLDLQDVLAQRDQRMAIVFITAHGDIPMSVRAISAGAVD